MVDYRLCNRIFPKQILIEKKIPLLQQTTWLFSFAKKHPLNRYSVPNDIKTDEWLKGLFPLSIESCLCTLYLIHYCWVLTTFKVLFSYLTLLFIYQGKNVKIVLQNPPNHLKHQTDVSRGNFGKDGFP